MPSLGGSAAPKPFFTAEPSQFPNPNFRGMILTMFNIPDFAHGIFWPILILIVFVVALTFAIGIINALSGRRERDFSVYEKRKYLFDTKSEFDLFNVLTELFSERFYVFPQVHYSHIVEASRRLSPRDRFIYWNSINRKSADFVLCDKQRVVAQLVIELDGSSHDMEKRKERDEFINHLMNVTGLAILHLKTDNLDRDFIKGEVERVLAPTRAEAR